MFGNNIGRLGAAALMIAAANPSRPAAAQVLPYDQLVVRVPCCRCIDGAQQTVNLNTGAVPWTVKPPVGASAMAAPFPVAQIPGSWTSLPPAQWVRHPATQGPGNYVYELLVFVPRCVIPARVYLAGRFAADNGASLRINANPPISTDSTWGFTTSVVLPAVILPRGVNTIRVRVNNISGRTAFLMKTAVTFTCPSYAEVIEAYVAPN